MFGLGGDYVLDFETMATENLLKLLEDIKNELESRGVLEDE